MENVLILRKVALGSLGVSGLLLVVLAVAGNDAFRWFGLLVHMSLAVFVATESFGPVARQRSVFGRNFARLFLGMYLLAGVSGLFYFVRSLT